MPGGEFDSSKTRVAPVFDALRERDGPWVRELLALAEAGNSNEVDASQELSFLEGSWGANEHGLLPPVALLSWLIRNLTAPQLPTTINNERENLLRGDAATIEAALGRLRSEGQGTGWHVFEGPTYPDAFIETPDALVVIEGKRTEGGLTTLTTWMPIRHQIWRHMDAAWEIRGKRAVYGMILVEGVQPSPEAVPTSWRDAAIDALSPDAIEGSFPHRGLSERGQITKGFLGVATWQRVCSRFGLGLECLPGSVSGLGA